MVLPAGLAQFWHRGHCRRGRDLKPSAIRTSCFVAGLLLTGPLLFARPPGHAEVQEVQMAVHDGHLAVVEGSIGPAHSLRFLLDTGSTHTVIDRKIATALNLAVHPTRALSFDKTISLDCAELAEIALGPVHATNLKVFVADLRTLRTVGVSVDAVVGLDLLTKENFRLDFARKLLVFGEDSAIGTRSVPLRADAYSLRVQLDLDGRPVSMILDTGAAGVTFCQDSIESLYSDRQSLQRKFLLTAGGAVPSKLVLVPRLRIGSQDLDRRVFLVSPPCGAIQPGIAGYLGLDALSATEISFDFARNELRWH